MITPHITLNGIKNARSVFQSYVRGGKSEHSSIKVERTVAAPMPKGAELRLQTSEVTPVHREMRGASSDVQRGNPKKSQPISLI